MMFGDSTGNQEICWRKGEVGIASDGKSSELPKAEGADADG